MRGRNLTLAGGALALGLAALALAACSEAGPKRAEAQLPELQVTISPAGCGEVAVAPMDSADAAFVYTSASPSTWAHATDTLLDARARAKAGCAFTRWTLHWSGSTVGDTTETRIKFQFISGMTATAHFSGTPATPTPTPTPTATATATSTPAPSACTQTTLGVDPATNSELAADCAALLAARDALRGTAMLNWSADTAMTSWHGVTLGGTPQRVTALALRMMRGTLPAGLGDLTALTSLNVEWSKLTGGIPTELSKLTKLRTLSLYRNGLGGGIPAELGKLTELRTLSLSQNFLSGGVPSELGNLTKLEGLFLYQNKLTGSIPGELGGLANLSSLYLSENEWTGCLPRALRAVANNDLATLELPPCPLPATTRSYDTYDTTGAVTAAGSYAFLSEADDGTMSAVSTYEALRDGTATSLLIHKSDAGGTSQADLFDVVEAGDLFEWKEADDCFVRYTVTEVKPDPAGTVPRKALGVEWMTYAFTGCRGAVSTDADASVTWGTLSDLGGTSLTAPIRHGVFQIVPENWTGAIHPGETYELPEQAPPYPGPYVETQELSTARDFPYWREPDLPAGWQFSYAFTGGLDVSYGYCAIYSDADGYTAVKICGEALFGPGTWQMGAAGPNTDGTREYVYVREARRISGRPAAVQYSPEGPLQHRSLRVTVWVHDLATQSIYIVTGLDPSLRGSNVENAVTIASSLFEGRSSP